MRIVDLSRELYHRSPSYPGQPPIIHGVWQTHEEGFVSAGSVWGCMSVVRQFETDQAFREERPWLIRVRV